MLLEITPKIGRQIKFPCNDLLRSFPFTIESLIAVVTCAGYETITQPRFDELVNESLFQEFGNS